MKRLVSLLASLAMVATLTFVVPSAAYAASYGACGDWTTAHYLSGQSMAATHLDGVLAYVTVPSSSYFHACSPDDDQGTNGPFAGISIENGNAPYVQTAWVQLGIVRCYNGPTYCDGTLKFITEWREGLTGATQVRSLGAASYNTQYQLYLLTNHGAGTVDVYINGSRKLQWVVDGEIDGYYNVNLGGKWFTETHDSGDGVGNNVSGQSTNYGSMKYSLYGGGWLNRGAACNFGSGGQINCHQNGAYGLYFYTVN